MATEIESDLSWVSGVTKLLSTDAATGTSGDTTGNLNKPIIDLANRTAYLKKHIDDLEQGSTIPDALAAINSPTFTGDPKAPTPGLGDNDKSLATTEFVQKTIGGILKRSVAGGANVTLTAIEAGNGILEFTGALTANISVIVPVVPTRPWVVINATTGAFVLTIRTPAGTGVAISQGKRTIVYCDGESVIKADTDLLASIKLVDGENSGIDADLLDGLEGSDYARSGVNANITRLTGLTTPLTKAQGGSGSSYGEFPVGTRMPFAQAAAPTGWVQDASDNANNRMLRVVNTAGGGVAGTHSPILNDVVPSHTHTITTGTESANHNHGLTDPGHSHSVNSNAIRISIHDVSSGVLWGGEGGSVSKGSTTSSATGISLGTQSASHTHSGTTNGGSSATNWEPRYINMIICAKS